jgi:hypothetical protein
VGFWIRDGCRQVSRPLRGVGVLAMPDPGLDRMQRVESVCMVPLGAGVLRLLLPGMAVGVMVDRRCVADVLAVTHGVIPAMRELFSKDEGMEF